MLDERLNLIVRSEKTYVMNYLLWRECYSAAFK